MRVGYAMERIAEGKTKTLFAHGDNQLLMVFKDDVTGTEAGVDPGGNVVVGRVAGKGLAALKTSVYFFNLLAAQGIPSHYLSVDWDRRALVVQRARWNGLEFIVRFKAYGSFVRRYGKYVDEGTDLGGLVEITVKDDERGDPLITEEAVARLGIMTAEGVQEAKALVKKAAEVIRSDLEAKGIELLDIKFECGLVGDRLVIIDDISTDNMRVRRAGAPLGAEELAHLLTGRGPEPEA